MKKAFPLIILLLLSFCPGFINPAFSQDQHKIDSLEKRLKQFQASNVNDTNMVNVLHDLSRCYLRYDAEKAMVYTQQTLELSEKLDYKSGIAYAYSMLGTLNMYKGDFAPALEFHEKALKIRLDIGEEITIAGSHMDAANVLLNMGRYPEALDHYLPALKLYEKLGIKRGVANAYITTSIIYTQQKQYAEATKNLLEAIKILETLGDKHGLAGARMNLGVVYDELGKYDDALKNYALALKTFEEIGDQGNIALCYTNIGGIYYKKGMLDEALKNYTGPLKIYEALGDKNSMAASYVNIGVIYTDQKKHKEALLYLDKALALSKETGSLEQLKLSYDGLAVLHNAMGNYKQSLEYYKLFITTRDSIINEENTRKTVEAKMQYEFDKQQQIDKEKQQAELKTRNIIGLALLGGIVLLCMIVFLIWKRSQLLKATQLETQKNLDEKEVLLREIHHRVKNNLAVISGLLYLQKNRVSDDTVKAVLLEGQNRIDSMILVHEMLYQSNNITSIELQSYLKKLINQIAAGFENQHLNYNVNGDLILEPKQAVPVGLILTELITNIYKYAYPEGKPGKFDLQLSQIDDQKITITLSDYGVGLPEGFDISKSKSLGLKLVQMLTQQMQGTIDFKNDHGTKITLTFIIQ